MWEAISNCVRWRNIETARGRQRHILSCDVARNMVSSGGGEYPREHLESCIDSAQNAPTIEGRREIVAHRRARVYTGNDENGKPKYQQVSGHTEDERNDKIVRAYVASGRIKEFLSVEDLQRLGLIANGQSTSIEPQEVKPKTDFCEYAENWFQRYKRGVIKGNSSYQIHYRLKFAMKFFQGRFLEDITTNDIQDYMNVNANYGHKTLTDFKGVLHDLFQHAEDEGDIEAGKIKWNRIKNPGSHEKHRKAQTDKHYSDIVAHLPDLNDYPMEQLIVAVFAYLGLRPEEVRGLRWEDVDLEAKRLHIERAVVYHGGVKGPMIQEPKTKGSKTWLPITDALYAILVKHKQESGWLVHEPNGEPIYSDHHWQKVWKSIGTHIDLHGMKACEFRKTVATVMVSRGVDVKSVQRTLRHSSANTTLNVYAETESEAFLNACNQLGVG